MTTINLGNVPTTINLGNDVNESKREAEIDGERIRDFGERKLM